MRKLLCRYNERTSDGMEKVLKSKLAVLDDFDEWSFVDYYFRADHITGWWVTIDAEVPCVNLHLIGGQSITVKQTPEIKQYLRNHLS